MTLPRIQTLLKPWTATKDRGLGFRVEGTLEVLRNTLIEHQTLNPGILNFQHGTCEFKARHRKQKR